MRANNKHTANDGRHNNTRKQRSAAPEAGLFAALDLGTNSCRMLIARPHGAEFEVVDAFSKPVHLGAGLTEYGTLAPAAIKRTLGALRICGKKLRQHGVKHSRLVATEACRRARNGDSFVNLVKRETGPNLEIIDPAEEARLAVVSCALVVSNWPSMRTKSLRIAVAATSADNANYANREKWHRLRRSISF